MLKVLRASILVLIFACSAIAGEINNPALPPPPQTGNTAQEFIDGEIPNPRLLTEISLNLLSSVLSLF